MSVESSKAASETGARAHPPGKRSKKRKQDVLEADAPASVSSESWEPAVKKKHKPSKEKTMATAIPETPAYGASVDDLANLGSNDDILRAIQGMGMQKTTSSLPGTSRKAKPKAKSTAKPATATKTGKHKRTIDLSAQKAIDGTTDHAHLLAHTWLSGAQLAELVKSHDLKYKAGKFSAIEDQQLTDAIAEYRRANDISDTKFDEIVFGKPDKKSGDEETFWTIMAAAIPKRPITAVYSHLKRILNPLTGQGKWTSAEDASLRAAVADYGTSWTKVSDNVGRTAADCRDRYRNYVKDGNVRNTGAWTKAEEEKLAEIVKAMVDEQGDNSKEIFWTQVTEKMGNTRSRQQCRIKWTDSLSAKIKGSERWTSTDELILVHKVRSYDAMDDTEIDWKLLSDADWDQWSAHQLQRRWLGLKKKVVGYEDLTHQEIVEKLCEGYESDSSESSSPPPVEVKPKAKKGATSTKAKVSDARALKKTSNAAIKYKSNATVEDSGDE